MNSPVKRLNKQLHKSIKGIRIRIKIVDKVIEEFLFPIEGDENE